MKLFTDGNSNAKIAKSSGRGYKTLALHLAPANLSGYEVCASRSAGCTAACLNTAGRGRFDSVQQARIRRTKLFFEDREGFKKQIQKELNSLKRYCDKNDMIGAVRMNAVSDIIWESIWPELFTKNPDISLYDYTKHSRRCKSNYSLPDNYHLTFSRSESNDKEVMEVLKDGKVNVAAVFDSKEFPDEWNGYPVYSADDHDLRFLDPPGGHIGALYAKGDGKKDETGFVIPVEDLLK